MPEAPGPAKSRTARVAALFLAIFGLLPIANWIAGGHRAPWYPNVLGGWWSGTLLVLGLGLLGAIASGQYPELWREGGWRAIADRLRLLDGRGPWLVAAAAVAVYLIVAFTVFDARPLLIDELIQTWQARLFATGHLWTPTPLHPEFSALLNQVDHAGKVYGQFPAGGPAMLLLGTLIHAEWLVGPLFGGLTVVGYAWYLRATGEPRGTATAALLILAFAPFTVFMAASYMNHVTSLMWIVLGAAALAADVQSERPRAGLGFVLGLGFGLAATIRPVDGFVFGAPAGLWLFARALRDRRRWVDCGAAALGMALPLVALCWVNARTTGHPLLFGYTVEWGPDHDLGFHRAPWGAAHTPLRGLQLLSLYFLELGTYFLETPFPALLPAIISLAFWRRLAPLDRYLLLTGALTAGFYFAYWHNGFYLGPRFMYPLLPALALWTARAPAVVRGRFGPGIPLRTVTYAAMAGIVLAATTSLPTRVRNYQNGMLTPRENVGARAAVAGVHGALVLVRESWGATLIPRMWALGVTRPQAEQLYHNIDICALDSALGGLEATADAGHADPSPYTALVPLMADSLQLIASPFSQDTTERIRPGAHYSGMCIRRLRGDQRGFTIYAPLILAGGSNVYLRDLFARDTLLLDAYPDRPLYVLTPPDSMVGLPARFVRVTRDSIVAAARLDAAGR